MTLIDFKNIDRDKFKRESKTVINENSNVIRGYGFFEKTCLLVMNKHAPNKTKMLIASHIPYMNKTLRKAIIKRTELETKYLKNNMNINLKSFKKLSNFGSKLYKKTTS